MRSGFLFARPSWLSGVARTLDLTGVFDDYNYSPTEARADAKALLCDWRVVGEVIRDAMKAFSSEPPRTTSAESD